MALSGGGGGGGGGSGSVRAGRAFVELFVKDNALYRTLEGLGKRFEALGKGLAVGGAAGVAAGTAALTPLVAAGKAALDNNTQIANLAGKLRVTTEDLSALAYAAAQSGQTFEDLKGHFENFSERIFQASRGAGEGAETFRQLNLDATQLAKVPITEAMERTLVALSAVTDQTAKLGMMSSLGGDKFQELALLADKGAKGIAGLKKEAKDVGAVLSGADAKQSVAVANSLTAAYTAARSTFLRLGMAVMPSADAMRQLQQAVTGGAAQVREFIDANRAAIQVVGLVGVGLVAGGTALVGFGLAASAVGVALVALKGLIVGTFAVLTSPVVLATAAVVGLGVAFFTLTDAGKKAGADIGAFWAGVAASAKLTFAGIGDALKTGDLQQAAKVAGAGLNAEWVKITNSLQAAWGDAMHFFTDGFESAVYVMKASFQDFSAYLKISMNETSGDLAKLLIDAAKQYPETTKGVARLLGQDQLAADLEQLARDADKSKATIDSITREQGAGGGIRREADAEKNRLSKEFADKQDAAKAKRDAAAKTAADDLAAAESDARGQRLKAAFRAAFAPGTGPAARPTLPDFGLGVGKAVRGAFAIGNASQMFGGSSQPVVTELVKHTALLKQLDATLRGTAPDRRAATTLIDTTNVTVTGATPRFT